MQGGRCWLGNPAGAEVLALVEGFATGASIHEATGWPSVSPSTLATCARWRSMYAPPSLTPS
jgi:hypothetical protein